MCIYVFLLGYIQLFVLLTEYKVQTYNRCKCISLFIEETVERKFSLYNIGWLLYIYRLYVRVYAAYMCS